MSLNKLIRNLCLTAAMVGCSETLPHSVAIYNPQAEQLSAALGNGPVGGDAVSVASEDEAFAAASNDAANNPNAAALRYLSLAYLPTKGLTSEQIATVRKATAKLINSLSWKSELVAPTAVDTDGLLLKINLADYGWNAKLWETLVADHPAPASTTTGLGALQTATGTAKPLIRAEWFVTNASVPPLYYALWQAPEKAAGLEALLKLDFKADITNGRVIRAGLSKSSVSTNDRVIERHTRTGGFLWQSYEFGSRTGTRDIFAFPLGPDNGGGAPATALGGILGGLLGGGSTSGNGNRQPAFTADGSEFIFTLPNGMLAFYIAGGGGERLNKVPGATTPISAGATCMGCHVHATIPATDEVRNHAKVTGDALATVRKLYVDPSMFLQQITQDSTEYRASIAKLGITSDDGDPVSQVVNMNIRP